MSLLASVISKFIISLIYNVNIVKWFLLQQTDDIIFGILKKVAFARIALKTLNSPQRKNKQTYPTYFHILYCLILKQVLFWKASGFSLERLAHILCISSCSVTIWKYVRHFLKAAMPTANWPQVSKID